MVLLTTKDSDQKKSLVSESRGCARVHRLEHWGGRYSVELGICTDAGDEGILQWMTAATLFGTRIDAETACAAYRLLSAEHITVASAPAVDWDRIVALLDAAHYVRYDFRTATRLQAIGSVLHGQYHGRFVEVLRNAATPGEGADLLDALPGWGAVTVRIFLMELRGVLPCADIPYDERALWMADHLGLAAGTPHVLHDVAACLGWDVRDLEACLVRGALAHRHVRNCPGGEACTVLS